MLRYYIFDHWYNNRAYNVNKLMPFQVKRLFELATEAGVSSGQLLQSPAGDMEATITRGMCMATEISEDVNCTKDSRQSLLQL